MKNKLEIPFLICSEEFWLWMLLIMNVRLALKLILWSFVFFLYSIFCYSLLSSVIPVHMLNEKLFWYMCLLNILKWLLLKERVINQWLRCEFNYNSNSNSFAIVNQLRSKQNFRHSCIESYGKNASFWLHVETMKSETMYVSSFNFSNGLRQGDIFPYYFFLFLSDLDMV